MENSGYEWFARFKNGDMLTDDKPHSGRPSTARINENVVCQGHISFKVCSPRSDNQSNRLFGRFKKIAQ